MNKYIWLLFSIFFVIFFPTFASAAENSKGHISTADVPVGCPKGCPLEKCCCHGQCVQMIGNSCAATCGSTLIDGTKTSITAQSTKNRIAPNATEGRYKGKFVEKDTHYVLGEKVSIPKADVSKVEGNNLFIKTSANTVNLRLRNCPVMS